VRAEDGWKKALNVARILKQQLVEAKEQSMAKDEELERLRKQEGQKVDEEVRRREWYPGNYYYHHHHAAHVTNFFITRTTFSHGPLLPQPL